MRGVAIVIPAFRPTKALRGLLDDLSAWGFCVVIVDDGSGPEFEELFEQCEAFGNLDLVHHASNRGKGAALRTGFQRALLRWPETQTIVTADADGQHLPLDVVRVAMHAATHPASLVLGVRTFDNTVPARSRYGNQLTSVLFRLLYGETLTDTQTGLRAVPRSLALTMLESMASGYEFELDMLITAHHMEVVFEQVPIQTVYLDGNTSSHFNPLVDSMRIYFVLLRYSAVSLFTAVCDNAVFLAATNLAFTPLAAQATGRLLAAGVNFQLNRQLVFRTTGSVLVAWLRYIVLVAASGTISYLSLMSLHTRFNVPLMPAKLTVETVLFLVNFVVQRNFVFSRNGRAGDDRTVTTIAKLMRRG